MIPQVMYHGTTQRFRRFDLRKAYDESVLGPAVYLTDNYDDAYELYANESSPDLTNRIERLADNMSEETDYSTARKLAKKELLGKHHRILHCKPMVKNVCTLANKFDSRETRIELWKYTKDEEIEETPEFWIIHRILSYYLDQNQILFEDSEVTFREIKQLLETHYEDWDEKFPGTILAEIMQALGYDAVLMLDVGEFFSMYRNRGIRANHLVVFNPDNVKISIREKI